MSLILDTLVPELQSSISWEDATDDRLWTNASDMGISRAGTTVTSENRFTLPAYYACIRNISEDLAGLPTKFFKEKKSGTKENITQHDLVYALNISPNSEMTSFSARRAMHHYEMGWGNMYAEIIKNQRGEPIGYTPIHSKRVNLERIDGELIYKVLPDTEIPGQRTGKTEVFKKSEILHVPGLGQGIIGYSVFQFQLPSIGTMLGMQDFVSKFFANRTVAGGVVTAE